MAHQAADMGKVCASFPGEVADQSEVADLGVAGAAEEADVREVTHGGKTGDGVTVALEDAVKRLPLSPMGTQPPELPSLAMSK